MTWLEGCGTECSARRRGALGAVDQIGRVKCEQRVLVGSGGVGTVGECSKGGGRKNIKDL